jgi:cyclophilin family peptidyl-prolyl cis-trans isomerase
MQSRRFSIPQISSVAVLMVLCVLSLGRLAGAQDSPPSTKAKAAGKASAKDLAGQWADLLARREKILESLNNLNEKFQAADNEGRRKIQAEFMRMKTEFEKEIQPGLEKLAPTILEKDPEDEIAPLVILGTQMKSQNYRDAVAMLNRLIKSGKAKPNVIEEIIGVLLQENRFKDVIAVADKLIQAKDVNPHLVTIDSMAHFDSNDFEGAKALAKRAAKEDAASAPGSAAFLKTCEEYIEFWNNEQEIRKREAQADDLPRVLLKTDKGDIMLELFENEAPNTVANFVSLVEAKRYDGTKFHRVIPNFMAQGGDPNTLDDNPENDGAGGPGYTIACECYSEKARKHFQGSLSMAHAGKDTGGSQFFITHVPTAHLNWAPDKRESNHTVFGRVIEGLDVALALHMGDTIESATVVRKRDHAYVPKKMSDKPAAPKKVSSKKTSSGQ